MSEQNKYKDYTAADIEKYHKGLLSPKEMNEMEKAALDDPFLADAMEGFANVQVDLSADKEELEKKLAQRVNEGKVVKMVPPFTLYRFLKIAAVVVLVAGGGLLIYQLGFNNSKKSLADEQINALKRNESKAPVAPVTTDSNLNPGSLKKGSVTNKMADGNSIKIDSVTITSGAAASNSLVTTLKDSNSTAYNYTMNATVSNNLNLPSEKLKLSQKSGEIIPKTNADFKPNYKESKVLQDKEVNDGITRTDSLRPSFRQDNAVGVNNRLYSNADVSLRAKAPAASNNFANYYNGRVTDNNNNAVPFANVTNIRDNVGTYADANGYFTLISRDTALNLKIRSVGFEMDTVQFPGNGAAINQVILKEDKMNGLVLGKKRVGKNPSPDDNIKIEEPEPADGWSNYGLYLANNLKVPDQIKRKEVTGEVQLSFEINKRGEPINIKVEKSLCKECDEEAKRVIQQGPKWKLKKKKNNRVTVTVTFEITQ